MDSFDAAQAPIYLSQEALLALEQELQHRVKVLRPEIAEKLTEAREMGDLSENFAYHEAREQQGQNESRVNELQHMLLRVVVVAAKKGGSIGLGSTFVVEVAGREKTFTIVGENEANPMEGRISNVSPLGGSFLGKVAGDTVNIEVPSGVMTYRVKEVR